MHIQAGKEQSHGQARATPSLSSGSTSTDYQDARHPSVAIAVCRHSEKRPKNQPIACYLTRETAQSWCHRAADLGTALSFSVECSI